MWKCSTTCRPRRRSGSSGGRTPKQYTLSWMPPKTTGGAAVHHYAVELEMLTNKGVRRGFKEVWQGAVAGRTAGVRAAVGLGEG